MPNIKSAAKRVRQTKTRTARNRALKTRFRTFRKKVQAAVESGDQAAAEESLKVFASSVDKAAKTNVIHKNAAARYKSSMAKLVATIGK